MLGKIAQWETGGIETIKMGGHPLFIERIIRQTDEISFEVSWRRDDQIIRHQNCPMLQIAIDLAVRWASERNMFGDPPIC